MENLNFISGGKTGDLIHNMYAVKNICLKENKKANIFITDNLSFGGDNFHYPINKTYVDLKDFFEYQDYVNSFNILQSNIPNFINLNSWRTYFLFGRVNWSYLLSSLYNFTEDGSNWMKYSKNDEYSDYIIIHRSLHRHSTNFPWERIVRENKCLFVTTDIREYESFSFKDYVEKEICEDINKLALVINSGKFFIGNMSTPLAIAHSLGVPRLTELFRYDEIFYIGEEKNFNNYFYYSENHGNLLEGINNHIEL
jgi:hypothetical protein